MEDLTVVVTGASSGVGQAAAEEFARRGARVVVVGRDPDRLDAAVASVRDAGDGREPDRYRADFNRLDDVRALAAYLVDRYDTIDVLANNAGGLVGEKTVTADGFESTIQANHLAPFLLTNLLRDRLRGGRVVNTASDAHRWGAPDPANLIGDGSYSRWRAYGASKAANILFAAEAARRWPDVLSTSYHPGVVRSRFGQGPVMRFFYRFTPFLTTPAEGADTLVWLATAPASEIVPGGFYARRHLAKAASFATDPDLAARLWVASAEAVGLTPVDR